METRLYNEGRVGPSVGACTMMQKMIEGFLCMHIVLK